MKRPAKVVKKYCLTKLNSKIMENYAILIKNQDQETNLSLTPDLQMIEEINTYLVNGEIFKTSLQRDIYKDISFDCLKNFFDIQLNILIEYYQNKGEFKIKLI